MPPGDPYVDGAVISVAAALDRLLRDTDDSVSATLLLSSKSDVNERFRRGDTGTLSLPDGGGGGSVCIPASTYRDAGLLAAGGGGAAPWHPQWQHAFLVGGLAPRALRGGSGSRSSSPNAMLRGRRFQSRSWRARASGAGR